MRRYGNGNKRDCRKTHPMHECDLLDMASDGLDPSRRHTPSYITASGIAIFPASPAGSLYATTTTAKRMVTELFNGEDREWR
jgi:hypothetical protein